MTDRRWGAVSYFILRVPVFGSSLLDWASSNSWPSQRVCEPRSVLSWSWRMMRSKRKRTCRPSFVAIMWLTGNGDSSSNTRECRHSKRRTWCWVGPLKNLNGSWVAIAGIQQNTHLNWGSTATQGPCAGLWERNRLSGFAKLQSLSSLEIVLTIWLGWNLFWLMKSNSAAGFV